MHIVTPLTNNSTQHCEQWYSEFHFAKMFLTPQGVLLKEDGSCVTAESPLRLTKVDVWQEIQVISSK